MSRFTCVFYVMAFHVIEDDKRIRKLPNHSSSKTRHIEAGLQKMQDLQKYKISYEQQDCLFIPFMAFGAGEV